MNPINDDSDDSDRDDGGKERLMDAAGAPDDKLLVEAERSVLGALLLHSDSVADVAFLRPEDFYLPRHPLIYSAIIAARGRGTTDPLVVGDELTRSGRLADAGGTDYLIELADSVGSAVGIVQHAEIVRKHAQLRQLAVVAHSMLAGRRGGADVAELVAEAQRGLSGIEITAKPVRGHSATLRSIADLLAMPSTRWLIKSMVPIGGIGFVVSLPSIGKTTLSLGWALSIYHGCPWHGLRVKPGSVLYIVGEGIRGIGKRIEAWRREHDLGDTTGRYFHIVTGVTPLSHADGQRELAAIIDDMVVQHGHAPDFVVIDTLSSVWGGESEDKSEFAAPFMAALARIAEQHGTTFCICHHLVKPPHDKPMVLTLASMRGSGAFGGSSDWAFGLIETDDGARLICLKQKEDEEPPPMDLRLHRVVLGVNEDSDPVSAAFFVPAVGATKTVDPEAGQRAREHADTQRLLDALRDLGETDSIEAVVKHAHIQAKHGYALFKIALAKGQVVNLSKVKKHPRYVVAEGGGERPPHP